MVVEEYSVSNGNVWRLEERLVVVRRWELQEREKVWIDQILHKGPQANPRTWQAWGGFDRERLETSQVNIFR